MLKIYYLKELLIISIVLSTISCTFVQKTKSLLNNSKYISIYSLIINIIMGLFFSYTFTTISFPNSIWIGLLSFIGADSIYKSLEGKISSYRTIQERKKTKSSN